jgi:hypothetical protein
MVGRAALLRRRGRAAARPYLEMRLHLLLKCSKCSCRLRRLNPSRSSYGSSLAPPILILSGNDRPPAFGNLNSYQNSSGEEKGTPLFSSLPASGERGQTQPERSLLGRIFISPARMGRRRILPHTPSPTPKASKPGVNVNVVEIGSFRPFPAATLTRFALTLPN